MLVCVYFFFLFGISPSSNQKHTRSYSYKMQIDTHRSLSSTSPSTIQIIQLNLQRAPSALNARCPPAIGGPVVVTRPGRKVWMWHEGMMGEQAQSIESKSCNHAASAPCQSSIETIIRKKGNWRRSERIGGALLVSFILFGVLLPLRRPPLLPFLFGCFAMSYDHHISFVLSLPQSPIFEF